MATGQGRARRYQIAKSLGHEGDIFPSWIPISPDSRDILGYLDQHTSARKPVGYQSDFLKSYKPNNSYYLSKPLRRQLKKMGTTEEVGLPAGTYGRVILNRLLIDLSWASSNLEGNTYSRLDTRKLIEQGQAAHGKAAIETQMIINHKNAIELLVDNSDTARFNRYTILNLHSALSENLLANPADEGRVRFHGVEIGKSCYKPLAIPAIINETLDMILTKAGSIGDPFEQSFFMMVHLPYLQPFIDINKRTSRLAANLPLIKKNLCPLTFLDVPEQAYSRAILGVYELTRIELLRDLFIWAYERSTQEYLALKQDIAEPDPLRLQYRAIIKETVHHVVTHPQKNPLDIIKEWVGKNVPEQERNNVCALINDELRRLHEGVLARYGLKISDLESWQKRWSLGNLN